MCREEENAGQTVFMDIQEYIGVVIHAQKHDVLTAAVWVSFDEKRSLHSMGEKGQGEFGLVERERSPRRSRERKKPAQEGRRWSSKAKYAGHVSVRVPVEEIYRE